MMHRRQFLEVSAMALATAGLSAAGFKTIDSQVHCYERNRPERPWAATLVGPDEMTGDQMMAAMDAVGVDGAVLVSVFTMYRYDASYVLEVEAKHADRFCLVKPVDTKDPAWPKTSRTGRQRRARSASGSSCATMSRKTRQTPASTRC